jgi:hypothetical protein
MLLCGECYENFHRQQYELQFRIKNVPRDSQMDLLYRQTDTQTNKYTSCFIFLLVIQRLAQRPDYTAPNGTLRCLQNRNSAIEVPSGNLREGTSENHDNPHSRQPIPQPRFELGTSRIQARSVTVGQTYSVMGAIFDAEISNASVKA